MDTYLQFRDGIQRARVTSLEAPNIDGTDKTHQVKVAPYRGKVRFDVANKKLIPQKLENNVHVDDLSKAKISVLAKNIKTRK